MDSKLPGPLYIHAGADVDENQFAAPAVKLEGEYWERKFGEAGKALSAAMPKHRDEYPCRAIVGRAQFTDVFVESRDPRFVDPYGLRLSDATASRPLATPASSDSSISRPASSNSNICPIETGPQEAYNAIQKHGFP